MLCLWIRMTKYKVDGRQMKGILQQDALTKITNWLIQISLNLWSRLSVYIISSIAWPVSNIFGTKYLQVKEVRIPMKGHVLFRMKVIAQKSIGLLIILSEKLPRQFWVLVKRKVKSGPGVHLNLFRCIERDWFYHKYVWQYDFSPIKMLLNYFY